MMQKSHFLEENLFMGLFHIFIFYVAYVCAASIQCLRPHGLWPIRLLGPWDSPGKNTGVGYHDLLQGIFLTQGPIPDRLWLLRCRQSFYC